VPIDDLDFGPDQVHMWNGRPFTGVAFKEFEGRLIEEISFVDGLQDGPACLWDTFGRLREVWHYYHGNSHRTQRKFDEHGRVTLEAVHEHGIETRQQRWDGDRLVESYELPADDPKRERLAQLRERNPWPPV
jgi:hypothetical protein